MAKSKVSRTAAPKKSDQTEQAVIHQPIGQLLSALLKHPDCPVSVYNAIGEEICDMQRQEDRNRRIYRDTVRALQEV